jgi:hypothetical protein
MKQTAFACEDQTGCLLPYSQKCFAKGRFSGAAPQGSLEPSEGGQLFQEWDDRADMLKSEPDMVLALSAFPEAAEGMDSELEERFMFPNRPHISTRQYGHFIRDRVTATGPKPGGYGTHLTRPGKQSSHCRKWRY